MPLPEHIKRVRLIARSRIAEIWEGYDERLKRKVLIKMLHPQLARDEDLRQRFEQEARILASQTHPNIVQIYEYHASAEELFLILEFVEGGNLRELLKEHTILPPAVASAIVVEILTGLHAAHEKGIIHRDLKLENILLSERGEVKIADFGLAMVRESPRLTLDGDVVGSPNYMAPEQVTGQEVTPRTDLFALGLMLFEMLTGIKLMEGATFNESLQKVQNFQLPRFTDYGDKISPDKERVLSKLLNPKSVKRFESADAARRALTEIGEGASTTETAPELLREFISMPREGEAPVISPAPAQPHRGRWIPYVVILVLLAIFLWAVFYVVPRIFHQEEPDSDFAVLDTTAMDSAIFEEQIPDTIAQELVAISVEPETTAVEKEQKPPAIKPPKPSPDTIAIDTSMIPDIPVIPDSVLLRILCHPWAEVVLDGRKIGKTPFGELFRLKSGIHRIIFLNENYPVVIDTMMTLIKGEESISVNFHDYVGVIRIVSVHPWADIFLDGVQVGRTPTSERFFVTLGDSHSVRLEHPDYPAWEEEVFFSKADTIPIQKDFTKP